MTTLNPPPASRLAETLYALLRRDDWRTMVRLLREWYAQDFPRWGRAEVEGQIGVWVGRLFIVKGQLAARVRLPETHWHHLFDWQAANALALEINGKLADLPGHYRRWCERQDDPAENAEAKVETVLGRLDWWKAREITQEAPSPV